MCVGAALALCGAHMLATLMVNRQVWAEISTIDFSPPNTALYMFLVNAGILLAPVLVVLLCRRFPALLVLCALPIAVNLAAQSYYEWLLLTTGTNPGMRPKGDWVVWLPTALGMLAITILALWLVSVLLWLVGGWLDRVIGPSQTTSDGRS